MIPATKIGKKTKMKRKRVKFPIFSLPENYLLLEQHLLIQKRKTPPITATKIMLTKKPNPLISFPPNNFLIKTLTTQHLDTFKYFFTTIKKQKTNFKITLT